MSHNPFFSIIVCTRNRPDIVKLCLFSLKNQSFKDFEVILSDNSDPHIQEKNFKYVKRLNCPQIQYFQPPKVLNMHDNYEFALNHAKGEYIGCLTDKWLLKKYTLSELFNVLQTHPLDIINYLNNRLYVWPNVWTPYLVIPEPEADKTVCLFDAKQVLSKRFSLDEKIGISRTNYVSGFIFFGFYKKSLVEIIKTKYKRLFHPLSPDFTSGMLGLLSCNHAAIYKKDLMITVSSFLGNGDLAKIQAGYTLDFLKNALEKPCELSNLLNNLPIPNMYTFHNLEAYDYNIINRVDKTELQIDIKNLIKRTAEDLESFPFSSQEEECRLWETLKEFAQQQGVDIERKPYTKIHQHKIKPVQFLMSNRPIKDKLSVLYNFVITPLNETYYSLKAVLNS